MIDTANLAASFAGNLDKPAGGFVKASVVGGPDSAGAFTLRLESGREVSVVVEEGEAKAGMTPGQNVLINLSDGKILVPNAAQGEQPPQSQNTPPNGQPPQLPQTLPAGLPPPPAPVGQAQQAPQPAQPPLNGQTPQLPQTLPAGLPQQPPLAGQTPQPAPPPVQPFVSVNADVFIAGDAAKQIRDGLESPLLRSLPAELFEKIAREHGGIDVDALRALDAVLRNRSLPLDTSSPLTLERLEQWLRLALDNPKLAEDLADRVPLAGAREIIDKFSQINRLCANFLPENLTRQLSAERFFPTNETSGFPLKELFAKAFSAAPAALLEFVKRIDTSEINANNVKLPPEEARKILGELANRLPAQAAAKPESVHDTKQFAPRVVETVTQNIPNKSESPNQNVNTNINIIPNKSEIPNTNVNIIPNKSESPNTNINIIPNKSESPNTNITLNKSELALPNTHIISSKSELALPNTHIISSKSELPSPNPHIISNKSESPNTNIIPNKSESPNTNVNIIPNKSESPNVRFPVPPNVYERIESSPRFNIPAESKDAVFAQIGAAREAVRQVINGIARTADASGAPVKEAIISEPLQKITRDEVPVRQAISGDIRSDNTINKHTTPPPAQQAAVSEPLQKITRDEVLVRQAISGDIRSDNTINKHTAPQPAQQAAISGASSPSSSLSISSPSLPPSSSLPPSPPSSSLPPSPPSPPSSSLPPSPPSPPLPPSSSLPPSPPSPPPSSQNSPQPEPPQTVPVPAPAPAALAQAAHRLLDSAESLRVGFQAAFSSLELQSRVFPSELPEGAGVSAVGRGLDALRLETLLNASKALQNIFSIAEELGGVAEFFSGAGRGAGGAERLLARAAADLARQARQSGVEIADRLGDALRELSRMAPDGLKGDGAGAARQPPAEIMRSAALAAAGGLESLHLLASAARGPDAQQQVVALPVKIGDEWTEVQVKIIKERKDKGKKGKKEGGGRVSVYLNAAPSKLGEVSAHLDYHPPASLKLSFQFGKPEAAKWFRERAAGLREALSLAGLPGAALEFHVRPRPVRAQSAENQGVRPVGENTAADAGRVDFRA